MENNKPKEEIVKGLFLEFDNFHDYALNSPSIFYFVKSLNGSHSNTSGICSDRYSRLLESDCFKSKKELIESL
ncbi:MAG: hypothetical protein ACK5LF_21290 [Bacteroides xylanisolvens]